MRVLHVIPSVGPLRGGPSFVIKTLASGLSDAGVSVDVVTTNDNGPETLPIPPELHLRENGVGWHYFRRQTAPFVTSIPLSRWVRSHLSEYDLVHIHAVFSWASTTSAWLARGQSKPYIVRPLGILNEWGMLNRRRWLKKLYLRCVEGRLLHSAAAVHFTSEQEKREALALGIDMNAAVIPNPVQFPASIPSRGALRSRFSLPDDRLVLLFCSRISEKKGLDLLIPAFAAARRIEPRLELVIAGEGEAFLVNKFKSCAREMGVEGAVHWAGFIHGDAKWAALADADIFVLPSYSENFGVAVVEAMGMSRPVLISDRVGLADELLQRNAAVVASCDVNDLKDKILFLASAESIRLQYGKAALETAAAEYTVDAVVGKIIALYELILTNHRGGI